MKPVMIMGLAVLCTLGACGQKSEPDSSANATSGVNPSDALAGTAATSQVGKMVKGNGVVTGIDANAGTVTLEHDAIPDAGWPAMTMSFKAPAEVISKAKPGEKVSFDLRIEDNGGTITAMKSE